MHYVSKMTLEEMNTMSAISSEVDQRIYINYTTFCSDVPQATTLGAGGGRPLVYSRFQEKSDGRQANVVHVVHVCSNYHYGYDHHVLYVMNMSKVRISAPCKKKRVQPKLCCAVNI